MTIFTAVFLAVFTVISAKAEPPFHRGNFQHAPAFRPHVGGTHFVARSGHPLNYGDYYDLPGDDTVYQGQAAPQDTESLPFATPTSDSDVVISPYEPHATISVEGIPHGAEVRDPVSNMVFLNP
jgi:hypothetical protein